MSIDLNLINNDNLAPRDEVRIERVAATPSPDGRRVKVAVDVTPFRERPNLEIEISSPGDSDDQTATLVANASVISTMTFKMAFNLHLRGIQDPAGEYTVNVILYYDDFNAPQDTKSISLRIDPDESATGSNLT